MKTILLCIICLLGAGYLGYISGTRDTDAKMSGAVAQLIRQKDDIGVLNAISHLSALEANNTGVVKQAVAQEITQWYSRHRDSARPDSVEISKKIEHAALRSSTLRAAMQEAAVK